MRWERLVYLPCLLVLCLMAGTNPLACLQRMEPRPPGTDGSAQWAYAIAVPQAQANLGSDAVLTLITGASVMPDGRLAANMGQWTLRFASYGAGYDMPITVDNSGAATLGKKELSDAIYVLGSPPGNFPDSTLIFNAAAAHAAAGTRTVAGPVECRYDNVAGSHVWTISFSIAGATETHRVRWDNLWLEKQ